MKTGKAFIKTSNAYSQLANFEKDFKELSEGRTDSELVAMKKYVRELLKNAEKQLWIDTPFRVLLQNLRSEDIADNQIIENLAEYEIFSTLGMILLTDGATKLKKLENKNDFDIFFYALLGELFETLNLSIKLYGYWIFLKAGSDSNHQVFDHGEQLGLQRRKKDVFSDTGKVSGALKHDKWAPHKTRVLARYKEGKSKVSSRLVKTRFDCGEWSSKKQAAIWLFNDILKATKLAKSDEAGIATVLSWLT